MSSHRVDAASHSSDALTRFSVSTDAECSTLARVLEVFAMRSVRPAHLHSVVEPVPDDSAQPLRASVVIQVAGLEPFDVDSIARKLTRVIGVCSVSAAVSPGVGD